MSTVYRVHNGAQQAKHMKVQQDQSHTTTNKDKELNEDGRLSREDKKDVMLLAVLALVLVTALFALVILITHQIPTGVWRNIMVLVLALLVPAYIAWDICK